jgi:hypothetical protein
MKTMTKRQAELLNHVRTGGYTAFYNEFYKAVQVAVNTQCVVSFYKSAQEAGYDVKIKDVFERLSNVLINPPVAA